MDLKTVYYYGAIILGSAWILHLLIELFASLNGQTKDFVADARDLIWKWVPLIILRIVIPYMMAYTVLAFYCVFWHPSTEKVLAIRAKIKEKILPK